MRPLAAPLVAVFLLLPGGCATTPPVPPLTAADVVHMSKEGFPPEYIIERLRDTRTVLSLRASDYAALGKEGVAPQVLDYLQQAQIEDIRWRERLFYGGGFYGSGIGIGFGFHDCPWPHGPGFRHPYARGFWC